jgi:predicted aspartyl protease
VLIGGQSFPLARGTDGRFRGTIRADGSELTVLIKQGAQYVGLARHEVR